MPGHKQYLVTHGMELQLHYIQLLKVNVRMELRNSRSDSLGTSLLRKCNPTVAKSNKKLSCLPSQLPNMDLTQAMITKIIDRKWKGDREEARKELSRVEVFRWLLRNGMNVADIDGVETKVSIQCNQSWLEQRDSLIVPQC